MKTLPLIFSAVLFFSVQTFAQEILPGTYSNRVDENGDPTNTYYGFPEGGMARFDSSPYKDFHLVNGPDGMRDIMNFRLLSPEGYDPENPGKKYPLILMLHGAGESGVSWPFKNKYYDPDTAVYLNNDHQLMHGGRQHLKAVRDQVFPGFVVFPQNESGWKPHEINLAIEIVEALVEEYQIDPNRIYVHGLSDGAVGVWQIIQQRPDLFAATLPISGVPKDVKTYNYGAMVHIPLWQFQGGEDTGPTPWASEQNLENLREAGGTPRYTLYPDRGHAVWNLAFADPDFFTWMLQYSKLSIYVFNGDTTFCEGEAVEARLGISPGFSAYEWRKDGSVIPGASTNELVVTEYGDYAVRFSRDGEWTEWSDPITIAERSLTEAPVITTSGSTALPAPDGSDTVTLYAPEGQEAYLWSTGATTQSITVKEPGSYTVQVTAPGGCRSVASAPVFVTVNGEADINPPSGLQASAASETAIDLTWNDNAGNELGYEVYRATSGDGPFAILGMTGENSEALSDTLLTPETTYYYKLRGVNTDGGSEFSAVVSATTQADEAPPTAPAYLKSTAVTPESISISWQASSDNVGVKEYNIYVDGELSGTTTDTTFTVKDLTHENVYIITVKAIDGAGNFSGVSNELKAATIVEGLTYKLYLGGTWDKIAEFASWPVSKTGKIDNFDISTISEGGVRPDLDVDYFAFDFEGYLYIEEPGLYTFYTNSDDGSKLFIDDAVVVDNDGEHFAAEKSGDIELSEGSHTIKVQYFDRTMAEILEVYYSGPGFEKQAIPDSVLKSSNKIDSLSPILGVKSPGLVASRVKIFPNPASDLLHIEFDNGEYSRVTITLIDQIGRVHFMTEHDLIQGDPHLELSLWDKNLRPGMYFLRLIYSDGQREHVRFLKE